MKGKYNSNISREELIELYTNKKLSLKQLGLKLNVNAVTVLNYMKRYDIKRREPSQGMKGKKHSKETKKKMRRLMLGKFCGDKNSHWQGGKRKVNGYIRFYAPKHPFKGQDNYVSEQRLVMEKELGRYITLTEIVHHLDLDRSNNNIDNLHLFESNSEHSSYHRFLFSLVKNITGGKIK